MDVVELLKQHEGFRSKPYRDSVGVLTIGYGHRVDELEIDETIAEQLLRSRVQVLLLRLRQHAWFGGLSEVRRAVLIDMAYQLGVDGLLKFTKCLFAVRMGDFAGAASEMQNSEWARQTPGRAGHLASMMRFDSWPA